MASPVRERLSTSSLTSTEVCGECRCRHERCAVNAEGTGARADTDGPRSRRTPESSAGRSVSVASDGSGWPLTRRKACRGLAVFGNVQSVLVIVLSVFCLQNGMLCSAAVPKVENLAGAVEWSSNGQHSVALARELQLSPASASLNSVVVTHNFTSDQWTWNPFTNLTCSSEVQPSARLQRCTHSLAVNLLDTPALASSVEKIENTNITALQIDENKSHTVSTSTNSSDGSLTVLLWVQLSLGANDTQLFSYDVPSTFGPLPIIRVSTGKNRTELRVSVATSPSSSTTYTFSLMTANRGYLQDSTWHHLVIVRGTSSAVQVFINSEPLPRLTTNNASLSSVQDTKGEVSLGGAVHMTVAGVHMLPMNLTAADIQCIYYCLERFVLLDTSSAGPLNVSWQNGGQALVLTGSSSLADYQRALRAVVLISNEIALDPSPRLVSTTLTDDCSSSSYGLTVYQACSGNATQCSADQEKCLQLGHGLAACVNRSEFSFPAAELERQNDCIVPMPTVAATTASTATTTPPTSRQLSTSAPAVTTAPVGGGGSSNPNTTTTAPPVGNSTQSSASTPAATHTQTVISGNPASNAISLFEIGISVVGVVIAALVVVLFVVTVRHYRAQQMMVVGRGGWEADNKTGTVGRRRYQYRSYADTHTVHLQSSRDRMSSLMRSGSTTTSPASGTMKRSMHDDFGMGPLDLESDPRQEVRNLNAAFYNKTPAIPSGLFFKPSIVPMKRNTFMLDSLPPESDDKQKRFSIPRNRTSSGGSLSLEMDDDDDDVIGSRLPGEIPDDLPLHGRTGSDPYSVASSSARRPSRGSMDLSSQDEAEPPAAGGDTTGRRAPAKRRLQKTVDDLQLDHELDDKVLAMVRAGTKKVRRNSVGKGLKRHGTNRRREEGSSAGLGSDVIISNQFTSVI